MARIDDYKEAFRIAAEKLKAANPLHLARMAGATLIEDDELAPWIELHYLARPIKVTVSPEVEVEATDEGRELSHPEKGLILHYLLTAAGAEPTGEQITFRQVPGGISYHAAFLRRARDPLIMVFGDRPERLLELGPMIGGRPGDFGDVSVVVKALPRVEIILVLWKGDDEFGPEGNILFDANITDYLPSEDIAMISGQVVYTLMGLDRAVKG